MTNKSRNFNSETIMDTDGSHSSRLCHCVHCVEIMEKTFDSSSSSSKNCEKSSNEDLVLVAEEDERQLKLPTPSLFLQKKRMCFSRRTMDWMLPCNNAWWTWKLTLATLLFCLSVSIHPVTGHFVGLSGNFQRCHNEGEVFPLPGSIESPCFTCLCRGGRVECEKQSCPSLQGCFLIMSGQKDGCCDVCKGCRLNNETYASGNEKTDGCVTTKCIAGVLTRSKISCYTACNNPLPPRPGECCPRCSGCSLHGRNYNDGDEATLPGDPCVRCRCHKGNMMCSKRACPVLSCPPSATYLEKGECCPRCNGSRTRYMPRTVCLLGEKVYPTDTSFRLDTCTNCTCVDTTAICDRVSCPPVECDAIDQVLPQGSCCPKCKETTALLVTNGKCRWNNELYESAHTWGVGSCITCTCDNGQVKCTEQRCPKNLMICPSGYSLQKLPGKCCPECVPQDGVCTVFGDPHYRSFDGKVFNFQGACKYMLTGDCKGKTFFIRARNDARESRAFSWTRTVTMKSREGRITLGQKMRIKFNGKRVELPFYHDKINITQDGYLATVQTGLGVKMVWDGESFLEVTVPHSLRGNLCGLCGNFNGNKSDDFMSRRKGSVSHPIQFGLSWRVGGKKACSRPQEVKGLEPACKRGWKVRVKAEKACSAIRSPVFAACRSKVPMYRFHKSCKLDMCECPVGRKCHCEVLTAYARACERAGVTLPNWRELTGCSHKRRWKMKLSQPH